MITVYSSEGCVQCKATYKAMDKAGIDYTVIDITDDPDTRTWLKDTYGYQQAPVVVAGEDHWSGYRPDRVRSIPAELRRAQVATAPDPPARAGTRVIGGVPIPEYVAPNVEAVETWTARVRQAATEAGPVPDLGTPEWIALSDNDPRKLASVVEAALTHTRTRAALPTELAHDVAIERAQWVDSTAQAGQATAAYFKEHPDLSPARRASHSSLQHARYGDRADEVTAQQALDRDATPLARRHGQDFPAPATAALTTPMANPDQAPLPVDRDTARKPVAHQTHRPSPMSI